MNQEKGTLMPRRTTKRELDRLAEMLNRRTGRDFEIEYAYGSPRLVVNRGSTDVSPRLTAGQLEQWIWAFMKGMDECGRRGRR